MYTSIMRIPLAIGSTVRGRNVGVMCRWPQHNPLSFREYTPGAQKPSAAAVLSLTGQHPRC